MGSGRFRESGPTDVVAVRTSDVSVDLSLVPLVLSGTRLLGPTTAVPNHMSELFCPAAVPRRDWRYVALPKISTYCSRVDVLAGVLLQGTADLSLRGLCSWRGHSGVAHGSHEYWWGSETSDRSLVAPGSSPKSLPLLRRRGSVLRVTPGLSPSDHKCVV